jgi:hypothetical protein
MNAALKLAAALAMTAEVIIEGDGYLRAPGFAMISKTLVALCLWPLSEARPSCWHKS